MIITRTELERLLSRFSQPRIGLVGDLFLDRYLELVPHSHELSIETGLEAYQVSRIRNVAGALGTIINNLTALGASCVLPLTVIGEDGHGFDLLRSLTSTCIDTTWIIQSPERLTPTYTKPLRSTGTDGVRWEELNRLDVRTREPLSAALSKEVCARLEELFETCDGLIVLDQISEPDCGVINNAVRQTITQLARRREKPVYIDSRQFLGSFSAGILKGNEGEVIKLSRPGMDLHEVLQSIVSRTGDPVFCTRGTEGILLAVPDRSPVAIPTYTTSGPVDIVGAGDAATSGIMLALLAGASLPQTALMGNLVASLTVQQLGTTGTASRQQVLARWDDMFVA